MRLVDLERLQSIASILHERKSSALKRTHGKLFDAQSKREQLLNRRALAVSPNNKESGGFAAESMWCNSVDAQLPQSEKNIADLEENLMHARDATIDSFRLQRALDDMIGDELKKQTEAAEKSEENSRDDLVRLQRPS